MNKLFATLYFGIIAMAVITLLDSRAMAQDTLFGRPDYRNRLYLNTPENDPRQPKSVAFYGGFTKKALSDAPSDGTLRLVTSSFGQPFGIGLPVEFFGTPILPPDDFAGVDATVKPNIVIGEDVTVMWDETLKQLFGMGVGLAEIQWKNSNGDLIGEPVRLSVIGAVDPEQIATPVKFYHTHEPEDKALSSANRTGAPDVEITSNRVTGFEVVSNDLFPSDLGDPDDPTDDVLYIKRSGKNLFARGDAAGTANPKGVGFVLLRYFDNTGATVAMQPVEVRPYDKPDFGGANGETVFIGSQILPKLTATMPADPKISKGNSKNTLATSLIYQHATAGAQQGEIYAIREVGIGVTDSVIEVYWNHRAIQNIVWPYELHRYKPEWPIGDPSRYQTLVRSVAAAPDRQDPSVAIPGNLNVELMPFQEPQNHASSVTNGEFTVAGSRLDSQGLGWALLKITDQSGVAVKFQVVRSVLHTKNSEFDLSLQPRTIGEELVEVTHEGALPGHVHVPIVDPHDWGPV
ncbi:MAG: hypothetical protein R3F19_17705 [Verrucomicrobiales bacterium]